MAYIDYYLPYECYSKDESIKLTINRELEVIDLHFDNNYYNDYYISDLEPYGWDFDEYNRWWSNVLNDFNFKYAINLINDYNSDPLGVLDYLDELEMTENIRSFDGMISTYLLPYYELGVHFDSELIENEYKVLLREDHWVYDIYKKCWCNELTDENIELLYYIINDYECNDEYDENEEIDALDSILSNCSGEDNKYDIEELYEEIPLIETTSDDGNIKLSNKRFSRVLELYFEHVLLDNYYWSLLENNGWEYDYETHTWYSFYDTKTYIFAIGLIVDYDDNPLFYGLEAW